MEMRKLGKLWPVSALTLGGAGLGQLWGQTTHEEAVATVREAVDSGITMLDMAPRYGDGEAERVIGDAFEGRLPEGVRVSTKYRVSNPPADEVFDLLVRSLEESLERMRLSAVDLFVVHGSIVATDSEGGERRTPRSLLDEAVRPAFERLIAQGRIRAWGITAIGVPDVLLEVLAGSQPPGAIQAIANLLDSAGELKWFDDSARPREIIDAAHNRDVGVMGIRVVGGGSITDGIDRDLPPDNPVAADFRRAAPVRDLAHELGESTASLAHRYALSMAGVDTIVLGVKNREELRDCLGAGERGPLPPDLVERIDSAVANSTVGARG
jgi:aryl-alcohol dehydrogenase-like predicted oxidoreductase